MNYFDFAENKMHGTPSFPLAYYYVNETHPRYEMPFHWHPELEISYILKGSCTFYLNGKTIHAKEGDVVFIDQGVIHGGKPNDCIYECVVFNPKPLIPNVDACKKFMDKMLRSSIHIDPVFRAGTHSLCERTKSLMDAAKTPSEAISLNILTELYRWFITVYETDSYTTLETDTLPDAKKMQVLRPVLEYIDIHYMQPIALEELAELANMSVSHFCRYFKGLIHKSPIDYLLYYRMEKSCLLLATTQLPLAEIAYQCGFNDISYFIHLFKKYKGITPKQYQKQYQ